MEPEVGRDRILEKRIGCVTGFFQIFGRQHVLNGKRLHRAPAVDYSSELERSVKSSSVSMELDDLSAKSSCLSPLSIKSSRTKRRPRTPESTTPAATTPVKTPASASGYEYKEMSRSTWKFRESPRLSLDSRAASGSIFTAQIHGRDDGVENKRKSTSVIARLMGLETLPDSDAVNPELRRSASESRVCKDLFASRFIEGVDSCQKQVSSSIAKTEAVKSSNQAAKSSRKSQPRRTSSYESGDVYPEQKQIETELNINLDEPLMDIATLKHVVEALHLKGLLRKTDQPSDSKPSRRVRVQNEPPPSSVRRAPRKAKLAGESFPVAARNRSPSTPRKAEEQRRAERLTSRSPRKIKPSMSKTGTVLSEAPSMSAETAFSDAQSIIIKSEEADGSRSVLERCDMLLRSMAEFNSTSKRHQQEGQPSPVSVLDSSFYNDDSSPSPSPVMKRSIVFPDAHADWVPPDDPDIVNISEVFRLTTTTTLTHSDIFTYLDEQPRTKISNTRCCRISKLHRKLIFDIAIELIRKHTQLPEWRTASLFNRHPLTLICSEFKNINNRREAGEEEDLIELIRNLLHNDLSHDLWAAHDVEATEAVVDVERLMFKDLIEEAIQDFAGKFASVSQPRLCRRLAF